MKIENDTSFDLENEIKSEAIADNTDELRNSRKNKIETTGFIILVCLCFGLYFVYSVWSHISNQSSDNKITLMTYYKEGDFYWDRETSPFKGDLVRIVNDTYVTVPRCKNIDPGTLSYSPSRTKSHMQGAIFFVTCSSDKGASFNYWFSLKTGKVIDFQIPD